MGFYGQSSGALALPPIVILATGQSNISREEALTWSPPSNLKIWNWNGTTGTVGTAFTAVSGSVIGVSQSFAADIARANPNQQVYLVRIAIGAIAIAQWLTGAASPDMFANITANIAPALTAAGATTIDTMLWWQGEKDAQNGSTTYAADFETMVARFRTQSWFPYATPITIFGINNETRGGTNYRAMNNTLARVAAVEPENRTFIYTAGLPTSYWQPAVDSHMTADGYTVAGKMAAHIYQGMTGRAVTSGLVYDPETGFFGMSGADPVSGLTISPPSAALTAMAISSTYPRLLMSSSSAIAACSENKTTQSASQGTFVNLYHNDGTAMLAGSRLGGFIFGGASSSTTLRNAASFESYAESNWADGTSYPSYLAFKTTPSGSTARAERMRITAAGNIGVGTTAPLTLLSVGAGSIADALTPFQLSTAGAGTQVNFGINKNGSYGFLFGYLNAVAAFGLNGGAAVSISYFRQITADPFAIVVNNTNPSSMWLSDGSVGLGGVITSTTTLAGSKLIVNGSTGQVGATSPTGGIGYATGAGGTVTQATSKSTGVTLNKVSGQITMNAAALGGSTAVGFTLTNSTIAATDVVKVTIASGATADSYGVFVDATAAGSCRISLRNMTVATSLSEAVVLNFAVIKSVNA